MMIEELVIVSVFLNLLGLFKVIYFFPSWLEYKQNNHVSDGWFAMSIFLYVTFYFVLWTVDLASWLVSMLKKN